MNIAAARPIAIALGVGAVGGALFELVGMPLPWMLGAMLATTIASMIGWGPSLPRPMREPMIAILGVMLGAGFTPELFGSAPLWLPTIASLPFYVLVVGGAGFAYLKLTTTLDTRTAFFAASPGGFGEMVVMAERYGADERRIALMHSVRILLIVLLVPLAVRLLNPTEAQAPTIIADDTPGLADMLIMLVCAIAGYAVGRGLSLPAGALLGPMLASALAHLMGLVHGSPPYLITACSQLVLGAGIGSRFAAFAMADILRTLRAGLGLVVVMLTSTILFTTMLSWLTGAPPMALFLALSPGGVAEMSLVAYGMSIQPAYVATHHIVRITLVVAMAPLLLRFLAEPT